MPMAGEPWDLSSRRQLESRDGRGATVCYSLGMVRPELAHLELLAEVDAMVERLERWADAAPPWPPAETCRAMVQRLIGRAGDLRIRLDAPLIVATLGGSGTGKSALVNALLGTEAVATGRQRPTTLRPALICRPDLSPEALGIDPKSVELIQLDLPMLADLVLIDCPDPDTAEEAESDTNLSRLRQILPHCDVLLVATTQQKYRSARVADELAAAASGARLVFVQTHADVDEDIRDDWTDVLGKQYTTGQVFLVDSPAALADAHQGLAPRGQFAALVDLLTRQLAGKAATRIRRANFLDLVEQTLASCRARIDEQIEPVGRIGVAIEEQRTFLAARLSAQMRSELLTSRRQWENRLLGKVASGWGLSPFSLVLRIFQGLGSLLAARLLWRARTPAQMALWGVVQGARTWQQRRQEKAVDEGADRAVAGCWDQADLRSAALVLGGHATEAGFPRRAASIDTIAAEADRAGTDFVANVSTELESLLARLAKRHTGWFTRLRYELALAAMLGVLLFRLGKNFFYDSWLAVDLFDATPVPVYGIDFYLSAGFWLLLWCLLLIWLFTGRLRRGLRREIDSLAETWNQSSSADDIFAQLEGECRRIDQFRTELAQLEQHIAELRKRLVESTGQLGHRR